MRINKVPSVILVMAFFHFRSTEGVGHGYSNAEDRFIDFFESSIHCDKCAEVLEQIDEHRRGFRRSFEGSRSDVRLSSTK